VLQCTLILVAYMISNCTRLDCCKKSVLYGNSNPAITPHNTTIDIGGGMFVVNAPPSLLLSWQPIYPHIFIRPLAVCLFFDDFIRSKNFSVTPTQLSTNTFYSRPHILLLKRAMIVVFLISIYGSNNCAQSNNHLSKERWCLKRIRIKPRSKR
jgi:hypothetical protein